MEELFAPPGEAWQRVSPKLCTHYRTVVLGAVGLVAVALVGLSLLWLHSLAAAGAVVVLAVLAAALGWVMSARRQQAWGYAEREQDLFITSGVMFRQLVAVPYGRMQFVDVTAGPLERFLGIATVRMHTATPNTQARIPGVLPAEAARLRDRLTTLGEAWAAGL